MTTIYKYPVEEFYNTIYIGIVISAASPKFTILHTPKKKGGYHKYIFFFICTNDMCQFFKNIAQLIIRKCRRIQKFQISNKNLICIVDFNIAIVSKNSL